MTEDPSTQCLLAICTQRSQAINHTSLGLIYPQGHAMPRYRMIDFNGVQLTDGHSTPANEVILVPIEPEAAATLEGMIDNLGQLKETARNQAYMLRFRDRDEKNQPPSDRTILPESFFLYGLRNGTSGLEKAHEAVEHFPQTIERAHPDYAEAFGGHLYQDLRTGIVRPETNCVHFSVHSARTIAKIPLEHIDTRFRSVQNSLKPIREDFQSLVAKQPLALHDFAGNSPLQAAIVQNGRSPVLYMHGDKEFHVPFDLVQTQTEDGSNLMDFALRHLPVLERSEKREIGR